MSPTRLKPLTSTLFAAAVSLSLLLPAASASAATGCDLVAAPNGSDSAPGTAAQPLRTAQQLADSLRSGQTGCLLAGTYADDEQVRIQTPGITLTSYPAGTATLRGRLRFDASADGAVVEGLTLDGRNPDNRLGPLIYADRVVLRDNEITNGHTAICVHIDDYPGSPPPEGVLIEGNRIHDCGQLPATNHHHGIYVARARGTVIRDNWIYGNADRGVQLYPDADDTHVVGNVIDGNGQGVIFSGDGDSASEGNVVERNVITNSNIRFNVESHWQGPQGSANIARRNCVWGGARDDGNGGIEAPQHGFTAEGNVVAPPRYVDPGAGNYGLQDGSDCAAVLAGQPVTAGQGEVAAGDGCRSGSCIRLRSNARKVKPGKRVTLRGEVKRTEVGSRKAIIQKRADGRWKRIERRRMNSKRRFRLKVRAHSDGKRVRYRAKVRKVGRSKPVRVKLRK